MQNDSASFCSKHLFFIALIIIFFCKIFTLVFEEFQIVNQDQTLEADLKTEVLKQETDLDKLNTKIADVDRQLIIKQKNVENLKDQKKSIHEVRELLLSLSSSSLL